MHGYMGKMLFVNLSDGSIETRPLTETLARGFMGGPGLGAKILYDEMPAHADVFGEDSMIGFVSGPLNANKALFGGRYTVVSKSPVTNGWNDANSGGFFGPKLKAAGYDAVFVKGVAEKPVYIFIDNGKVEIRDASRLWGQTVTSVEEALRKEYGDKINAAIIGPAGEQLSYMAAVMNDGHRAAGRGGSGAVMGSKKLKAVVVRGNQKAVIYDNAKLIEVNKKIKAFMDGPMAQAAGAYGVFGTGVAYVSSALSGDAGIKNWGGSGVTDYPEEAAFPVSSIGMDKYKVKKYNCSNCPLGCGAIMDIPSERWNLRHTPRPEYETMGSFGSMLLNKDMESVARANDLCNEYGLDTISTGCTVAWAMECYENGVLSKDELEGIELNWGNGDAIAALTEKICRGEGVGAILAKGSQAAADSFGKGHEYLVVASGIEEPMHDSRMAYGLARTYQYDPTPGRHVKGGLSMSTYKHVTGHNFDYRGTGYLDMRGVIEQEIINSSGLCYFCIFGGPFSFKVEQINAVTGFNYTPAEIMELGLRIFNIRHAFNLREGKRRKDCTLSRRMYSSNPPNDGPLADIHVDHELLADNLFNAIGWDVDGVPHKESLEALGGLEQVIADIYPSPATGAEA